jgi:RNA polymerase sigma-70 factor, ECF subfamily
MSNTLTTEIFLQPRRGKPFAGCYIKKLALGAIAVLERRECYGSMEMQDYLLAQRLAEKDEAAFEQVFKTHFKNLHAYACTLLSRPEDAEEMVQQVFFKLWERQENLSIGGSLAAYLYRAVHNQCLNHLKHEKVKAAHQLYVAHSMKNNTPSAPSRLMTRELENRFRQALNELPEQCRTIFQMSRFEDMKYRDIAGKLDISVKTVENQMGKALKLMRLKLAEYIMALLIIFNL